MNRLLVPLTVGLGASLCLVGCEIADNCDTDTDPNCESPDAGGTDNGICDPCGALAEGTSRCDGNNAVATCVGGCLETDNCGEGSWCDSGAECHAPYRFIRIDDGASGGGSHPGADIDGVELVHNGESFYAARITDFQDNGGENPADNTNAVLGVPEGGTGSTHACDIEATTPHWYSLNGGFIILSLDGQQPIQDGDTLYVYECVGTGVPDRFDLSVGIGDRADGEFVTLGIDASGLFQKVINFTADGLRQ